MLSEKTQAFQMSPQQERLWFLWRMDRSQAYRARLAALVEGDFDAAAFTQSLRGVIAKREILRTTFKHLPGMSVPVQVVGDCEPAAIVETDLSGLDPAQQEREIAAIHDEMAKTPFDLERGPVFNLRLATLSPARKMIFMSLPSFSADGVSARNILREICSNDQEGGHEKQAEPEAIQYAELAEWQNQLLESKETSAGRLYWAGKEIPDAFDAPAPFERPAIQSDARAAFDPERFAFTIRPELAAGLDRVASDHDVASATVLLACWQALLGKLTGLREVVVGRLYDGRKYEELAGALGPFERYLPLAGRVEDDHGFNRLIAELEQEGAELYERQEFFSWRDMKQGPLFSFCFSYDEEPGAIASGGARFSIVEEHCCAERFKLKLSAIRAGAGLRLEIHFDAALFRLADIQRLSERFETLFENALARPSSPIGALEILSGADRQSLLFDFNDTAVEFQTGACVHEMIREQAIKHPGRPAVGFEDRSITYAELNAEANRLANLLRRMGVTAETRVAILLDRCAETIVSLLGVLKAGGAYTPLDPGSPKERLAGMIEDSGARVVVTQNRLAELISGIDVKTIRIDGDRDAIESQSDEEPPNEARPDSLAYVIYTSGSTGRPKGVAVEHRQLSNYINAILARLGLPSGASFATVSTLAADLGNTAIFPALASGGCLHVIARERLSDAGALADYFERRRIDCLKIVPSHLEALLASPRAARIVPRECLVLGGEASSWKLIEKVESLAPSCRIFNHYGPTETTIGAITCAAQAVESRSETLNIPLGQPLANVQVYLLNSYLRPAPAGVAGEVYIGGAGVARGYLGKPDLTAERFIPDPFSSEPGARLYRTGDLARRLPDENAANGSLEFLGRIDDQVKIRGFRIELGEIEAALQDHQGVEDAVVLPREDAAGNRKLVAYVTPRREYRRTIEGRGRYRLPNRMEIAHLNRNETDHGFREIFERQGYFKHGVSLGENALVLDVGANIGLFSLFVSDLHPDATIYAFEPIKPIYDVLRLNAELYGPNVRARNLGLSDAGGTAQFTYFPGYSVMSGLSAYADAEGEKQTLKTILRNGGHNGGHNGGRTAEEAALLLDHADELLDERFAGQTAQCRLATISEIIEREAIERIDLLKIDAQKSEADVLGGIRPGDWEKIDQIVMEAHDQPGQQTEGRIEGLIASLEDRGYRVIVEQEEELKGTDRHMIYALRDGALRDGRRASGRIETAIDETSRPRPSILEPDELDRFLGQKLPDYMIPSHIVLLDALPLNSNGKIDRKALPSVEETGHGAERDFEPPRTEAEKTLAAIWAETLGLDRVGVNDNFFKLGGDSIISIQIIVKANQAGIYLTPRQFFQHQTIAGLAAAANEASGVEAEQGAIAGPAPLTPIQRWFFEDNPADPHHWNMALLLETRRPLDSGILDRAARALLAHHDALRLRFAPGESGWEQTNAGIDDSSPLTVIDLSELDGEAGFSVQAEIERAAARVQASLDLTHGPTVRLAHFKFSGDSPARLLIVIHHLSVDGVSWRILIEDLKSIHDQLDRLSANGEYRLPPKSTSFRRWAERLVEYAQSDDAREEADYWLGLPWDEAAPLPGDFASGAGNSVEASRAISVALTPEETQSLIQKAPEAYNTQINDALLAALARALRRWTGRRVHLIEIEGHGREEIFEGVDLTRTVGCFTTRLPVLLETVASEDAGEQLKATKELLRRIPRRGIGYGVLRYLSDDAEAPERLRRLPRPEISFNYLGQLDQALAADSPFAPARESAGPTRGPKAARRHLIEINGGVTGGRLEMVWRYAEGVHRGTTVETLAGWFMESLRELISHCLQVEAGGFTASDFADFGWTEQDLDQILDKLNRNNKH